MPGNNTDRIKIHNEIFNRVNSMIFANIVLNNCIDSIDYEAFKSIFEFNFYKYYNMISFDIKKSKFNILTYLISWNLQKTSEVFPEVFPRTNLNLIVNDFLILLHSLSSLDKITNKKSFLMFHGIILNFSNILINLISLYGDKKTEKLNTAFSCYNKNLSQILIKTIDIIYSELLKNQSLPTKQYQEALTSNLLIIAKMFFRIIKKLIEFSGDDYQDFMENDLDYHVSLLKTANFKLKEITAIENSQELVLNLKNVLFDYQENLVSVINTIYSKIKRMVTDEISLNILESIFESFESHNKLYFSGINCIGFITLSK